MTERPSQIGPLRVHFQANTSAPRETVFAFFADHDRFGTLFAPPFAARPGALIRRVAEAPEGDDPNGLGSVRAVRLKGLTLLEEVIVGYEPDQMIEYTATRGPIRNHLGRIVLEEDGRGGTHIDYRIWLDGKLPGLGALLGLQLRRTLASGWRRARRQLEVA